MGIYRDSQHKRRSTGGRQVPIYKKRKYELGRPAAMTKLGEKRISTVRTMGGNKKYRALRLESGNFSWSSEATTKKTRILDVVYNPANMEYVRTKILTKGTIVSIDATPFRQYYADRYAKALGVKKGKATPEADLALINKKRSKSVLKKVKARSDGFSGVDQKLSDQVATGRLLACVTSRPGQGGRCDGYILEGKELDFYQRKLKK